MFYFVQTLARARDGSGVLSERAAAKFDALIVPFGAVGGGGLRDVSAATKPASSRIFRRLGAGRTARRTSGSRWPCRRTRGGFTFASASRFLLPI